MPDRRRLNRLGRGVACAAALLAGSSLSFAAEPSIRVIGGVSMTDYAARVDSIADRVLRDAAAARDGVGRGALSYFDLNKPLGDVAGFDALPAADRVLMRGAKRTYDLFRALGGPRVDSFAVTASETGRYYLSLDGEGGRWLATPGAALTMLARQLAETRMTETQSIRSAGGPCADDYRCLLKSFRNNGARKIATVPRGATVTLEIKGKGFSGEDGAPVIKAPDGITPGNVTVLDSETIKVPVTIGPGVATGRQTVMAFDAGKQFSGRKYDVLVVENPDALDKTLTGDSANSTPAKPAPPADDYADTRSAALPLGTGRAGRLDYAGDADTFRIDLAKGGALSVSSDGPTDVVGELRNARGELIATDDDGGARYNFRIGASLPAGTYYLRIRHCCGGKGDYHLTQSVGGN